MIRRVIVLLILLHAAACESVAQDAGRAIRNPDFMDEPALASWTTHVYGVKPEISLARDDSRGGRRVLRVASAEPTDTAFGQEIVLKPSAIYRLSGWVRTKGLDPHDAPVFGTFQVQRPEGRGVIATGKNHGGDSDWTRVEVPFRAPDDGRTRIAIFFTGFGRGTGTAWFDHIRLEELNPAGSRVRVTRDLLAQGRISPLQYGQFIEYLCDLVPSMWAEKLYDGSFEGLSAYKFVYLKETDFKERPWYPSGATNRVEYSSDRATRVSGEVSQRISVPSGPPCTAGISQDGIAVKRRVACRFSVYLRQNQLLGPVRVRLHAGGSTMAFAEFCPTSTWAKFTATFAPTMTTDHASITIEFRGPGTLWLDSASLVPADAVQGWRRDVVDALRALKPGVIRFGGSALDDPNLGDFHWGDTLGNPDRRPPFRAWGGLQQAGAGLEEIVQLCRLAGAEPLICVRFSKNTPAEAAAEVEYFNGAPSTPMGTLRAKNGHAEPYHIRYWQVGNELAGDEYNAGLPKFCEAMKRADPSIQLLSSFPTPGAIRSAGAYLDFVCPHQYDVADLAGTENHLAATEAMIRREAPGRPIRIAVTEWNTTAGDVGPHRAMLWTLENALACSRYQNLLHRYGGLVTIANRSNLTNSFCSGIIQTDRARLYVTPTYYAQQLYATLAGDRPLRIESDVPAVAGPDISATLSKAGDFVSLFAVNDTAKPIQRALDISVFGNGVRDIEVWTLEDRLHAGEKDVTNSFDFPERVSPTRSSIHAAKPRLPFTFPAYSLTVIRFNVSGRRHKNP